MHRKFRLATLAALITVLPASCSALEDSTPTILVGVDLPLTGNASAAGAVHHRAIELYLTEVNERLIRGDRRVQLRELDNRSDPAVAEANLADLAADPNVDAIVAAGCPNCIADAAPDLTVPVISLDTDESVASPASERRWVFRLSPNADDCADQLSRAMAASGAGTVGVIATDDAYGTSGVEEVEAAARRDQLEVAVTEQVATGDQAAVAAAADTVATWPGFFESTVPAGPDAVVVWSPAPGAAEIARALRDAGYEGPLYLDMLAADQPFLSEGSPLTGATMVHTPIVAGDRIIGTSPSAIERINFHNRYLSEFGAYDLRASWAADALAMIVRATNRIDETVDRSALRDKIESGEFVGITGLIRVSPTNHSGLRPSSLALFEGGDRWL